MKKASLLLLPVLVLLLTACGSHFQKKCSELEKMVVEYEQAAQELERDYLANQNILSEELLVRWNDLEAKQIGIRLLINKLDAEAYEKNPPQTDKEEFYSLIKRYKDKAIILQKMKGGS